MVLWLEREEGRTYVSVFPKFPSLLENNHFITPQCNLLNKSKNGEIVQFASLKG